MTALAPQRKSTLRLNLARQAANWLDSIGEAKRAEDVRALIRSNATANTMLQQLHRDNMALRQQLATKEASHV